MNQEPLFDVDQPPVRVPVRSLSKSPKWSAYRPKNSIKCDDCMLVLALAKGNGPASNPARWKRVAIDGSDLLLCYQHAAVRREEDGLKPLKDRRRTP